MILRVPTFNPDDRAELVAAMLRGISAPPCHAAESRAINLAA